MELRVFDKTVQPLGAIDELASLLWHTKYFDVGTFSLLAPITDNNSRLLVCKDGRNHRKGSIYHCGSESRTGRKCWLGTLEEWRRLD